MGLTQPLTDDVPQSAVGARTTDVPHVSPNTLLHSTCETPVGHACPRFALHVCRAVESLSQACCPLSVCIALASPARYHSGCGHLCCWPIARDTLLGYPRLGLNFCLANDGDIKQSAHAPTCSCSAKRNEEAALIWYYSEGPGGFFCVSEFRPTKHEMECTELGLEATFACGQDAPYVQILTIACDAVAPEVLVSPWCPLAAFGSSALPSPPSSCGCLL
eukprot:6154460-Amphidinium_carterae.1